MPSSATRRMGRQQSSICSWNLHQQARDLCLFRPSRDEKQALEVLSAELTDGDILHAEHINKNVVSKWQSWELKWEHTSATGPSKLAEDQWPECSVPLLDWTHKHGSFRLILAWITSSSAKRDA